MVTRGLLQVETALALVLAWIMVFLLPRGWLASLGSFRHSSEGGAGTNPDPRTLARARGVAGRVHRTAARLPWHSTCLVQAVAGTLLLRRRGIGGWTIRFGVRKQRGNLEAHAWLLLGTAILLGGHEVDKGYVPLADMSGPPPA